MVQTTDKSQYILPLNQPIVSLEVKQAFEGLTDKEKLYAHYISEASFIGSLITFLQTSPESGPIFVLLHKFFSNVNINDLKTQAKNAGITDDDINAFMVYACGIFGNSGNYKSFGDMKIIPGIDCKQLENLLQLHPDYTYLEKLWNEVKGPMYDLGIGKTCLGFPPQCTTYLSKNCTVEDNKRVQNWMKNQNLECYNTRLFKTENNKEINYEIRLASVEQGELKKETDGKITYRLTRGDYSPIIGHVAQSLRNAAAHAGNDTQKKMLKYYIQSFTTGSLDDHKKGSRYWIQDKGPNVENYIGFIETYRDPAGIRGEFEGFVAVVNRPMSDKFQNLVNQAEKFLPLLPWNNSFEKDKFLRPDFTSLDVLTFAGSGIPAGINIPNYDDIRQSEGFKNVSLGNVIPASYQMNVLPFLNDEDADLFQKYRVKSFEVQVGLHELLGHGSGKLFQKNKDGIKNYPENLLNPLTGEQIKSCYEFGDTYDSIFGPLSSPFEECRAEAVGLYLSLEDEVLKIFGYTGKEAEDIKYVNWLSLVWNGIGRCLEFWSPEGGWLQAHSMARFALAKVLIQAGIVQVTQPSNDDLLIKLDRSQLLGPGRIAIGQFLLTLQIYKSTADKENAMKFFHHYTDVTEPWISWRKIILANKQPRKLFCQANTFVEENAVKLKTYEESIEGMIQSYTERFSDPESLYSAILELTSADAHHFA